MDVTSPQGEIHPTLRPDASCETSIAAMFHDYEAMIGTLNVRETSQAEFDRPYDEQMFLEWRTTQAPSTCAADVAPKVLILTQMRGECGTIFELKLLAGLEQLVVEAS